MIWPFKKKPDRADDFRKAVSTTIHDQVKQINDLVADIRDERKECERENATKHSTS